ncbi:sigma-70 family RNA polymerase sigma factor [Neobacillus notoginsengisoli]|uniref:Sigma-70 family RNA polymerase sigma factor n=1 Tax=Neobacillus notoginsengisoli TaxID=1578198 RepID=A0A417YSS3_9BACI|nr:sigma-70 family RNA polymerase sigma factor [Neobacillus notoginsengisoli]RHW39041.1 sigma-70 family RNA polymerase sigma factor [Neobacillus notoginsengisoli]
MEKDEFLNDLMDRYGTAILHLAYSFARNRQTAEDLSQEIFIKCYENLDRFRRDSGVQTWLYRIAVNHCKDYVKSWHYRKVHASEFIASLLKGQQDCAETQYFLKEEQDELIEAVFQLPVKYKEVIILAYFHDLTMKEISEVCGVNINTVKSRAAKSKVLLKQILLERSAMNGGTVTGSKDKDAQGRIV